MRVAVQLMRHFRVICWGGRGGKRERERERGRREREEREGGRDEGRYGGKGSPYNSHVILSISLHGGVRGR
jgi:hypothetical protein